MFQSHINANLEHLLCRGLWPSEHDRLAFGLFVVLDLSLARKTNSKPHTMFGLTLYKATVMKENLIFMILNIWKKKNLEIF